MNALETAKACARAMLSEDLVSRDLGIDSEITAPGHAVSRITVDTRMINGLGVCHGGYIFTLADTAFAYACNTYNRVTFAAGASIDYLRPGKLGDVLTATATERHRSRRTGVYDIVVTNQDGATLALFRGKSRATEDPML